jgi:TusE/DsrC/DsvC family sulfur relay protein
MGSINVDGISLEVDEKHFLKEPEKWNRKVAEELARSEENIENLTEEHWIVINYIRDYFEQYGIAPIVRRLCKQTGFDVNYINQLFPSGPAKGACKIAGLPEPTGCV